MAALQSAELTNYHRRLFFRNQSAEPSVDHDLPSVSDDDIFLVPWSSLIKLPPQVKWIHVNDYVHLMNKVVQNQFLQRDLLARRSAFSSFWSRSSNTKSSMANNNFLITLQDQERYAYQVFDQLPGGNSLNFLDNSLSIHDPSISLPLPQLGAAQFESNSEQPIQRWFLINQTICLDKYNKYLQTMSGFSTIHQNGTQLWTDQQSYFMAWPRGARIDTRGLRPCTETFSDDLHPVTPELNFNLYRMDNNRTLFFQAHLYKYTHVMNLDSILKLDQSRQPHLIHFGSLFGKDRIRSSLKENEIMFQRIRESIIIQNPIVDALRKAIVKQMGGPGSFIAAHIRVSDGSFSRRGIITRLNMLEHTITSWVIQRKQTNKLLQMPNIYIATDFDADPRNTPAFQQFISRYPGKIYFLADFNDLVRKRIALMDTWRQEQLEKGVPGWNNEMTSLFRLLHPFLPEGFGDEVDEKTRRNVRLFASQQQRRQENRVDDGGGEGQDGLSAFARMWIPFVEQQVCAHGWGFAGTRASTFSAYIERLYRVHWTSENWSESEFLIKYI